MAPQTTFSRVALGVAMLTISFRLVGAQAPVVVPVPAQAPDAMKFSTLSSTSTKSGIAYFRALLMAGSEEREKLLAGKSPEHRRVLVTSVERYEALSPEDRELRLRTMELRFHVTSLLRVPPSKRDEQLKRVPESDRPIIEERLKYWDGLTPAEQKEALENEQAARILGVAGPGSKTREIPLTGQTSNQVRLIEKQLVLWQGLPEGRRQQVEKNFTTLFEFSDEEKTQGQLKAMSLSPEERELMERTIAIFKKLPVKMRESCVQNFPKFAGLSPTERRQFLYNAQEWQKLPAADRENWRKLVSKVPRMPPLPPGFGQPPKPPRLLPRIPAPSIQVTNN